MIPATAVSKSKITVRKINNDKAKPRSQLERERDKKVEADGKKKIRA